MGSMNTYDSSDIQGIIPQAINDIFSIIENQKHKDDIIIKVSYLEIYNEEIFDLLDRNTNYTKLKFY